MNLVLASASPRRLELLRLIGVAPLVDPPAIDEVHDPAVPAADHAVRLAREKALTVAARHPDAPVLAADTVVVAEGRLLGKPRDPGEARGMLELLSGRGHHVLTAVHLVPPDDARWVATSLSVWTAVIFRAVAPAEIERYVASREWEGKAGAYAIQGVAAGFVRAVVGSYTNVVGLPLAEVQVELARAGILPG